MHCNVNKYYIACAILTVLLFSFTSCDFFVDCGLPMSYTYKFSIKNETNSDLDIRLKVGEIPDMQSPFNEFTPVPDEIYKMLNESWLNESHSHRIVKPNKHEAVVNFLPIDGLGLPLDIYPAEEAEKQAILREKLLNRLFSFVLTVSRHGEIVYRIAGWDVPDEDMKDNNITDKLFGCYNTAPENYVDSFGETRGGYPLFYLSSDGTNTDYGGSFTYYIKAFSDNAFLQEFIDESTLVNENDYWRKH